MSTSHAQMDDNDDKGYSEHIDNAYERGTGPDTELDKVAQGDVRHMGMDDRATALRLAHAADPGPPVASYRSLVFFCYVMVVCACSGDNGFDGTVMSSINSMKQYQHYFGLKVASSKTGIIFGIYTVGQVLSFFPASYLPDRIGRRYTMMLGNIVLM